MGGINWQLFKSTVEECTRAFIPPPSPTNPSFEPRWQYGSDSNAMAAIESGWKVFVRVVNQSEETSARRYVVSETTDRLDEVIATTDLVNLEVRAEADFHDEDASRWAARCVDYIRKGYRFSTTLAKFKAADFALVDTLDTVDVSFEHEGRWVNAYSFETQFRVASCWSTADWPFEGGDGVDYFDTVFVSSHVLDAEGVERPEIQFTNKKIPE